MKIIIFATSAPSFDKNNYHITHTVSRSAIMFQAEKAATLKGRRFETISENKANATKELKVITRTVSRSGNTVAISACVGEESTLKGTQTRSFQIKYFL